MIAMELKSKVVSFVIYLVDNHYFYLI